MTDKEKFLLIIYKRTETLNDMVKLIEEIVNKIEIEDKELAIKIIETLCEGMKRQRETHRILETIKTEKVKP